MELLTRNNFESWMRKLMERLGEQRTHPENWEKLMGDQLEKLVTNEKFISEMSKSLAATMTGFVAGAAF